MYGRNTPAGDTLDLRDTEAGRDEENHSENESDGYITADDEMEAEWLDNNESSAGSASIDTEAWNNDSQSIEDDKFYEIMLDEIPTTENISDQNQAALSYNTFSSVNANIPGERKAYVEIISPPPTLGSRLLSCWQYSQSWILYIASFVTTLPVSIYAFTYPSGINPENITLGWWSQLPMSIKILSLTLATISLGIGTLMRIDRIPKLLSKMKDIFLNYCPSAAGFIKNNFIVFLSGVAAIAALALGYYGFIWSGQFIAMSIGVINFLLTFGFRIDSMTSMLADIRNLFDKDYQFQQAIINQLRYLKPEQVAAFDQFLKTEIASGHAIDEAVINRLLLHIYDSASAVSLEEGTNTRHHQILLNPPRQLDKIKNWIRKMVDFGLGTAIGTAFFIFFAQNGYDGMKISCLTIFENCTIDDLPYPAQMALAVVTGMSSGILGFIAGKELSNTVALAIDYMKQSCTNKVKTILVVSGSGVSAISMAGAVKALTDKSNLFGITTNSINGKLLLAGNWMLAASYDLNAIMSHLTKNEVSFNHAIRWLEINKLSSNTLKGLRQHGYFSHHPRIETSSDLEMTNLGLSLSSVTT